MMNYIRKCAFIMLNVVFERLECCCLADGTLLHENCIRGIREQFK